MKYNEFTIGDKFITEEVSISKQEVIEFARKYDPQYFHVDEDEAKTSIYGALIASGFQTIVLIWKEFIKLNVLGRDCQGGPEADYKWIAPVKPGDRLIGEFIVTDKREASSKPIGILTFEMNIRNQFDEVVLTGTTKTIVKV